MPASSFDRSSSPENSDPILFTTIGYPITELGIDGGFEVETDVETGMSLL